MRTPTRLPRRFAAVFLLAAAMGGCAAPGAAPSASSPASTEMGEVVGWGSGGWRYAVGPHDYAPGFERAGFDDAAWTEGAAPFGTRTAECESGGTVRTEWPLGTDLLLRREIRLPAGARGLRIELRIDNDAQVFVNGADVTDGFRSHDGCAERDPLPPIVVPGHVLREGVNVVAVRARDRGIISFLDLRATVEAPRRP